jgi:hypothetical protein
MTSHSNDRNLPEQAQGRASPATPIRLIRADDKTDRILYVSDVLELLRHEKSAWWVRNHFAPELRFKIGRSPAWWESDAVAWLARGRSK